MQGCTENYTEINDHRICWFEWGVKQASEPVILLVHATGFHARCWDAVVANLGDRHVIAVDMRGHGRSSKEGPFTWDWFGSDLTALIRSLDLEDIVGVGHSMGGHSVAQAAAALPDRFRRLVLVDPVIMSPEVYSQRERLHDAWLGEDGEHPVAKRRNHFKDPEEMILNFHNKASYGIWQEQVLRDYCVYGLLPDTENGQGFVLACPPKVEAAIYMGSSGRNIYDQIQTIQVPVRILRAKERTEDRKEMDFSLSPTWSGLADCFARGEDIYLPDLTHFIPMQAPELTAQYILQEPASSKTVDQVPDSPVTGSAS
ncbi:MAG: alpha/beta hydrolase [Gammaproteobacteria bacterium]|nr:alpha/beta hydrolase [Gammaproteobacteria bacterium]